MSSAVYVVKAGDSIQLAFPVDHADADTGEPASTYSVGQAIAEILAQRAPQLGIKVAGWSYPTEHNPAIVVLSIHRPGGMP